VQSSGRTNSGVHALAQIVAFHPHAHPPEAMRKSPETELPDDVFVFEVEPDERGIPSHSRRPRKRIVTSFRMAGAGYLLTGTMSGKSTRGST